MRRHYSGLRKVTRDDKGWPTDLPCPSPRGLQAYTLFDADTGRGCALGWAMFAISGDAVSGADGLPVEFAAAVMRRCGPRFRGVRDWGAVADSFNRALQPNGEHSSRDMKFAMRFCMEWRNEANARGYDISRLPRLK